MPEPVRVEVPMGEPDNAGDPQAQPQQEQPQTQLLAGKFKTAEELEKGYKELEQKLGSQKAAPAPKLSDTLTPSAKSEESTDLDLTPYQQEYDKNGKLSDESYAKLTKEYKVGKGLIDEVIAARVAKVQAFQKEVFDSVGGQENFGQMLEWAKGNLDATWQVAYDKAMASGDPGVIKLAVQAVNSQFVAAYGKNPSLIGGRAGSSGPKPFRSVAEMTTAMSDPRYDNDEAFRKDVENRLAISDII